MLIMKKINIALLLILAIIVTGCFGKNQAKAAHEEVSVLVFITGVIAGSPTYEMLAEGALEFAASHPAMKVKIYEAGMNQSGWEQQLAEMISTGEYEIVIGSNPSLPEMCANVSRLFPDIKFIIVDAFYEGHPQIRTYLYNQYEQSLVLGYLAGLVTISDMPNANAQKKVGFLAAQEYPLLTGHMVPGFSEGARIADPTIELDFRVIGSWADANKAAELTSSMINSGVDVFTSIAGGAAQGLIKTAADRGAYVVWYNTNAYDLAPGVIVGCGIIEQKKLVKEILNDVIYDKVEYGYADVLGIREGYISFIFDHPSYQNLPQDIREKFELFLNEYNRN